MCIPDSGCRGRTRVGVAWAWCLGVGVGVDCAAAVRPTMGGLWSIVEHGWGSAVGFLWGDGRKADGRSTPRRPGASPEVVGWWMGW